MAKLVDKEGITSFQQIRQLSQELTCELQEQSDKSKLTTNSTVHFWDFEEDEPYDLLEKTKQVA